MSKQFVALGLTLVMAACSTEPGAAQDWRTVTQSRRSAGEERLEVVVEYGAGRLRVEPATPGTLYRATLRYDAERFTPVTEYRDGRLRIGIGGSRVRGKTKEGGRLDLAVGTDVAVDLDMEFGAGTAELELGGLRILSAELSTGASDVHVRFSSPNPERARLIALEAGAASMHAYGLGNANAERVRFAGGVGEVVLDFTGEWRADMRADVEMGIGSLTLRVPEGLGVRVIKDSFLTSFDSEGLIKRGGSYYSQNWDTAAHKLTINVDAAFGSIDVEWVEPATASN